MRIEFENTLEDLTFFTQYSYNNSPSMQRRTRIVIFSFTVIWFLIFVLPNISRNTIYTNVTIWLIISLIWALLIVYSTKKSVRSNARRLYSEGENKGMIGKHLLEVSPEFLKETTEFNELRTKWVAVNKIEEDENYIYIFLTSVSAHVIPKKYFDTKSDIVKFVQEVQHHIDKNKV